MNAFTAKDGSRHTNRDTMQRADARFGAGQKAPVAQGDGDPGDDGEQADPQDGKALAAEHGPATEIAIHHDHAAGKHSVHAEHPDGHSHDTEHGSADEAHQFAADAAGVGAQPSDESGGEGFGGAPGGMAGM